MNSQLDQDLELLLEVLESTGVRLYFRRPLDGDRSRCEHNVPMRDVCDACARRPGAGLRREGGEMKITKEVLVEMRRAATEAERPTVPIAVEAGEILALLDERKALRAELRAVYDGEGANSQTSRALSLGEDEE